MSVAVELLGAVGPIWSVPGLILWLFWQLYCPFPNHTTKLQQWHEDLTQRLKRIEIVQIAISEEVGGVDEETIKEVHGKGGLSADDLKAEEISK